MAVQVHGRLLQARLLLENNAASTTAHELAELIQQIAEALVARRQLMRADCCIPAVIRTEYLRTAAALVDILVKPAPPYAAPMDEADAGDVARCISSPCTHAWMPHFLRADSTWCVHLVFFHDLLPSLLVVCACRARRLSENTLLYAPQLRTLCAELIPTLQSGSN